MNSINPLKWPRQHQVALLIALIIGAVAGIVVGYFAYAIGSGADGALSFKYWVKRPIRLDGIWWSISGAAIGFGITYAKRLLS